MKQLPQNFLVVNNEGVFRCYTTFEEVVGLEHLLARHAQHRYVMVKDLAAHPLGMIHLGIHTREGLPFLILEAYQGTMGLETYYRSYSKDGERWIAPRYYTSEHTFEMRCEFDFKVWTEAGFKIFFGINFMEHSLNMWTTYEGQNYRVPFGNIYEDGKICTGEDQRTDLYFRLQPGGWVTNLDLLINNLSASKWNGDAIRSSLVNTIMTLVRFNPDNLQMLPPLNPNLIKDLGINGHPTLAEITKHIIA